MSWIIGADAPSKINELAQTFHARKLAQASQRAGREFSRYEPWMGHPGNVFSASIALQDDALFCFDDAYIRNFGEHFEKNSIPILDVKGEARRVFLFPGMAAKYEDGPNRIRGGWHHLLKVNTDLAGIAQSLVIQILPVRGNVLDWGNSVTSHLLPGLIFMGLGNPASPFPVQDMAVGFAHEIGHQALLIYQNADPILNGDLQTPIYSGVRKMHRPAIMAIHAAVALAYMIDTTQKLVKQATLKEETAHLRDSQGHMTKNLIVSLNDMTRLSFTDIGARIMQDLWLVASQSASET